MSKQLEAAIDAAWEKRDGINSATKGEVRDAVEAAIAGLDDGSFRTAQKFGDEWVVNQWLKKAVLLSFRLTDNAIIPGGPEGPWFDKVPSKFKGWDDARFRKAGFRAVPNSVVRKSAYVAPGVVLMPSFVNVGAYVDSGTMVDTWATVGSCAQIGRNVHLSGGVGIGGGANGGGATGGGGAPRRSGVTMTLWVFGSTAAASMAFSSSRFRLRTRSCTRS